ncbi:MAG: hypothetical protein EOO38_02990 [Cytophagaceae bacterium]|nr:MAG: hypothetical protein EOO38_02990 [Cytophagaceae bacterium]
MAKRKSKQIHTYVDLALALHAVGRVAEGEQKIARAQKLGATAIDLKRWHEVAVNSNTDPKTRAEACHALSHSILDFAQTDDALAQVEQAIALMPTSAVYLRTRSELLLRKGDVLQCESACRQVLQMHPTDAQQHVLLGEALAHQSRYAEAERAYRTASKLCDGMSIRCLAGLADVLDFQGKTAEAKDLYDELGRSSETCQHRQGSESYARWLIRMGCMEQAKLFIDCCTTPSMLLGDWYLANKDYYQACRSYDSVWERQFNYTGAFARRAEANFEIGSYGRACSDLKDAFVRSFSPIEKASLSYRLALIQERWSYRANNLQAAAQAAELDPSLAAHHIVHGDALLRQGDHLAGHAAYARGVALAPTVPEYYERFASACVQQGDLAPFRQLMQTAPQEAAFHQALGRLLYEPLATRALGKACLQRAQQLAPGNPAFAWRESLTLRAAARVFRRA